MARFEVLVDIQAVAVYEVEAKNEAEATEKWQSGKFLSLEAVESGVAGEAYETFDDDDGEVDDPYASNWD